MINPMALFLAAAVVLVGASLFYWLREWIQKPTFGRAPEWARLRREHLEREPGCVVCQTRVQVEVHHVKPVSYYPELERDPTNLMTLCPTHHLEIGHLGKWSAYNPHVRDDAVFWARRRQERVEKRL